MKKLIALVAALVMVAGTAYAADWSFYGSSRVATTWTDTEVPGSADVEDYATTLNGNSRIGANVKVNDELTGRFEYGHTSTVNLRILYGEWNFGAGSFLVGQTYSPLNLFYSNQIYGGDYDLLPYGGVYSGRNPMLRLKFGDFQIAAVAETSGLDVNENSLPTIEAKYSFSMDNFSAAVAAGYNTYEAISETDVYDVDSYVIAAGASLNMGVAYLKGDIYAGQNANYLIWTDYTSGTELLPDNTGTNTNDIDNFGFLLVAGAKINDMLAVEAGYGFASADKDGVTQDDEVSSYYVQATVTLAPGVFFVPELGVIDYEEADQNEISYLAIKWQINF